MTTQKVHARALNGHFSLKRGEKFIWALGRLWNDRHLSASQCANELGVTRNVVIGVVHRHSGKFGIEFKKRDHHVRAPKTTRSGTRSTNLSLNHAIKKRKREAAQIAAGTLVPPVVVELPRFDIPVSQRCFIEQLTELRCRFPVGECDVMNQFYCGGLVEHGPYCSGHHKLTHAGLGRKVRTPSPFWR